jgi:hypothetical protein
MATAAKSHFNSHNTDSAPSSRKQRRPRPITETERLAIEPFLEKVHYSPRYISLEIWAYDRYSDDEFEYRLTLIIFSMLM